jgi:hypothetical protein
MRKGRDENSGTRTPQEWAEVAEQVADRAKQEFRQPSGPTGFQAVGIVGVLVLGIAYALGSLFFPQLFAVHPPGSNSWLNAHPIVDAALGVLLLTAWFGFRIWWANSLKWHEPRKAFRKRKP